MTTFLLAFIIMALVIAGMAIGVICGRKPIKGSCGGLNSMGVGTACEICGGNPNKCDENESDAKQISAQQDKSKLAYEAK